ncbi:unnamed protein product [Penicillium salamii]|nr:unnamed protein product [Penicillium salamii]CAG8409148.1 unnamed protein product [Penicillium salamii]
MSTAACQFVSHFDGIDGLKKVEAQVSPPGSGEVLVEIHSVSLNYRDMEVIRGEYNHHRAIGQGPNIVPCSDMCGVVKNVGQDVTKWKVGDRVLSTFIPDHQTGQLTESAVSKGVGLPLPGVLATHRIFADYALIKAPEHMSDQEASTLTIASVTAWMGINGMRPLGQNGGQDEYVLLQGTGGVGIAALQIAKASGAKGASPPVWASYLGFVNPNSLGQTFESTIAKAPDWEKSVMDVTKGHGADIILETGGAETILKSFQCAAYGGLINCIGYTSGKGSTTGDQPNINLLTLSKTLTLKGIINGPTDRFEEMVKFYEKHEIHPVVNRVFTWSFRSINRLHLQPYILIPWLVSDLNSFMCSPPVNVALAAQANEKQPCTIVYLYHVAIEFSFRLEMLLYIRIFRVPPCS